LSGPDSIIMSLLSRDLVAEAVQLAIAAFSSKIKLQTRTIRNLILRILQRKKTISQVDNSMDRWGFVLRLLRFARKSGKNEDDSILPSIIEQLVSDGDIIEATFLFETSVRGMSYHGRDSLSSRDASRKKSLQEEPSYPTFKLLLPILTSLHRELSSLHLRPQSPEKWMETRKVLIRLLDLFGQRTLPVSRLSLFVKTLHAYRQRIRTMQKNGLSIIDDISIDQKAHDFLTGLIRDLEYFQGRPQHHSLDLNTLNSLLHYSLRFCRSQDLASIILRFMFEVRAPPMIPHAATCNILLRSSSLLRDNRLARKIMEAWASDKRENKFADLADAVKMESCKVDKGAFTTPPIIESESWPLVPHEARTYTTSLVAYITHWTSVGKSGEVVKFIHKLFPCLDTQSYTLDQNILLKKRQFISSVQYAARLGPHVVSAILNSVVKTGKIGLLEKIWHLVTQAEVASWDPTFVDQCTPWRLSIHSYTSVLKAYSQEKQRAIRKGTFLTTPPKGWALALKSPSISVAAHTMGSKAYSHRESSGSRLLYTLDEVKLVEKPGELADPEPDEHFFHAALDLFGLKSKQKGLHLKPSHRRLRSEKRSRLSLKLFLKGGYLRRDENVFLRKVLWDMQKHGYTVPTHYIQFFINRTPLSLHV